jgi:hypothetical protein
MNQEHELYYVVAKGRNPGIYYTWQDCQTQINGFSGAKFKKCKTYREAIDFFHNETCSLGDNEHVGCSQSLIINNKSKEEKGESDFNLRKEIDELKKRIERLEELYNMRNMLDEQNTSTMGKIGFNKERKMTHITDECSSSSSSKRY